MSEPTREDIIAFMRTYKAKPRAKPKTKIEPELTSAQKHHLDTLMAMGHNRRDALIKIKSKIMADEHRDSTDEYLKGL